MAGQASPARPRTNLVVRGPDLGDIVVEDVDIDFTDGVLTISGERKHEEVTENGESGWWRREIFYGKFSRSVALPQGIDAEAIRAAYDAGILTVSVPLPNEPSSKVKVEVGGSTHKELES